MEKAIESWATHSMREFIFWRDGMSPEEFEKERDYFYQNIDMVRKGEYVPLWKQNKA